MKKAELKDWRAKTPAQIEAEITSLSTKLTGAYLAKSAGKLQNTALIKNTRRDIAWLRTVLGQQQKASANESQS